MNAKEMTIYKYEYGITKSAINKALKTFKLCSQYPGRCAAQKAERTTFSDRSEREYQMMRT